jgi:hypothetical protein
MMTALTVQEFEIYQKLRAITDSVTVTIEVIWPDEARTMLDECNKRNRRIKVVHLRRIVDDFIAGRFAFNGATIVFGDDGMLLDGQHRLMACAESGLPFIAIVVRGLPSSAQDNIDVNVPRSVGDILQLNGVQNAVFLGTLGGLDLVYQNHPDKIWSGTYMPTKVEAVQHALDHQQEFQEATAAGRKALSAISAHATAYAQLFILVGRSKFADAWEDFNDGVLSGVGLSEGDARLTLRNYIMRGKFEYGAWGRQRELALYIKSFNAYVNGEEIRMLKFTRENLPMPSVVGS